MTACLKDLDGNISLSTMWVVFPSYSFTRRRPSGEIPLCLPGEREITASSATNPNQPQPQMRPTPQLDAFVGRALLLTPHPSQRTCGGKKRRFNGPPKNPSKFQPSNAKKGLHTIFPTKTKCRLISKQPYSPHHHLLLPQPQPRRSPD